MFKPTQGDVKDRGGAAFQVVELSNTEFLSLGNVFSSLRKREKAREAAING